MLTCRDQQAAAYKGSRKINRPATHPIHFAAEHHDTPNNKTRIEQTVLLSHIPQIIFLNPLDEYYG